MYLNLSVHALNISFVALERNLLNIKIIIVLLNVFLHFSHCHKRKPEFKRYIFIYRNLWISHSNYSLGFINIWCLPSYWNFINITYENKNSTKRFVLSWMFSMEHEIDVINYSYNVNLYLLSLIRNILIFYVCSLYFNDRHSALF